jgi:hypothetical protein
MTPAWPIARSSTSTTEKFSAALDERTMVVRGDGGRERTTVVWDFVAGKLGVVEKEKEKRRRAEEVNLRVLRPRKEMRYYFTE